MSDNREVQIKVTPEQLANAQANIKRMNEAQKAASALSAPKGYIELNDEGTFMLLALHNIAGVVKHGEATSITLHTVVADFDPISHSKLLDIHYDDVLTLMERAQ